MRITKAPKFWTNPTGFALSGKPPPPKINKVAVERSMIPIEYYSDVELACIGCCGYTMVFDIESYRNYFLIGFMCIETGKYVAFEDSPDESINLAKLQWMTWNFRLVGFNSRNYDIPMMLLAMRGYKAPLLKDYTNRIINSGKDGTEKITEWNYRDVLGIQLPPNIDHIDIQEVCPLKGSLKKYLARLHAKRIQELPYDVDALLSKHEAEQTKNYCLGSDIVGTAYLFSQLSEQIKLRYALNEKYGVDVRSKSDAQIAETVMKSEVFKKTKRKIKKNSIGGGESFYYIPPAFLQFDLPILQEKFNLIRSMQFSINDGQADGEEENKGKLSMPEELKELEIPIGSTIYKLGKGGLHSKEKCASYKAGNGMMLLDIDVESFYPRLILNSGLYPEAIGPIFLEIFKEIVDRRLDAKAGAKKVKALLKEINDKLSSQYKDLNIQLESFQVEADGLKITINGTFGKMGSRYSVMYAPNLLIQVTLTGQLALLMLIGRMEAQGIRVVSANTDGIVLYIHESQYELLNKIKDQWCKEASLKMEETRYSALYSRDVNNYIAVKLDGSVKLKGAYSNPWNDPELAIFRFHKNPVTTICIEAIEKLIIADTPISDTIRKCRNVEKFIFSRDVKGGAHKNGVYLGGTVRAYYGQDERGTIQYILSGNNVPDTEGAIPCMDLPDDVPDDLDYSYYEEKAKTMLYDLGFYKRPEAVSLFN